MSTVEQFFNFLATLYTPRRALITLFMIGGIILSLIKILPAVNLLLVPPLKLITSSYLGYTTALTATIGLASGVLVFSIVEKLYLHLTSWIFVKITRLIKLRTLAREKAEERENQDHFIENFETSFPHLHPRQQEIIRELVQTPHIRISAFGYDGKQCEFLLSKHWLYIVTDVGNYEYLYGLNPVIKAHILK